MLHQLSKLPLAVLVGGALITNAGSVYAQDGDMEENPCDGMSENPCDEMEENPCDDAGENPCGENAAAEEEITMGESAGAWPLSMHDRPLTLMEGMFSAGATIVTASKVDVISLGVGGGYGISNELTVGLSYGVGLKPSSDFKGPILISGAYTFFSEGELTLAGTGTLGYHTAAEAASLAVGVKYWYHINDKLTVFGGGNQISIGIDPTSISMSLPVSVGYQLNPNTFLSAGTSLGTIAIVDAGDSFFLGADTTPLTLVGTYSPNNTLDVFAGLYTDLTNTPADTLGFLVGATYYGGN